jgi:hypothetical protein
LRASDDFERLMEMARINKNRAKSKYAWMFLFSVRIISFRIVSFKLHAEEQLGRVRSALTGCREK